MMANLKNIQVFINMIAEKNKKGITAKIYNFKINNYLMRIILKLKELQLIKNISYSCKNFEKRVSFELNNLKKINLYHRPTINVNQKNYKKIVKQELKENPYNTLLLTTSKGIMTLKQAITGKIGGYVIAKYTGYTEVFYQ